MKRPEHCGLTKYIKAGDYDIGETGDILALPHYPVFLFGCRTDLNEISRKAA